MDYTPRCSCGVQVDRQPDDGLSRRVFGDFLTARMRVSVGRLPQEVLLEEFYRSYRSETVQVGRVRVFEELLTVFNCSVLTFWNGNKLPLRIELPSTLQYFPFNISNTFLSQNSIIFLPSTLHTKSLLTLFPSQYSLSFISSKQSHTCGRFICTVHILLFISAIIINSVLETVPLTFYLFLKVSRGIWVATF
jgi:hypothetical protein